MKRSLMILTFAAFLSACGGGGVDTTVYQAAAPNADSASNTASSSITTDNSASGTAQSETDSIAIAVPDGFDFSNFKNVQLQFEIPNDLIGFVKYRVFAPSEDTIELVYNGSGFPSEQQLIAVELPRDQQTLEIDYTAYDRDSDTFSTQRVEVVL